MPTEAPPTPPKGPEMKLPSGSGAGAVRMDQRVIDAANAAAARNAPQDEALPEPPVTPPPPPATPPAVNAAQPEASKEPAKSIPQPTPEEPKGIKQVRDALERRTKEYDALRVSADSTAKERADALAKMADLETRLAKQTDELEKDYKPRAAKLAEVEKRLVEKEEVLRIRDYQSTDEFHNNFVKPIADAYAEATSYMGQLVVGDGNGGMRNATQDDLNEIIGARSLNEAATLAQDKFGPILAPTIVNMKVRINGLERARQEKVKNAGIDSAKWVENQQIQMNQNRENFRNAVFNEAQRLISENEHLKISDDDAEGKQVLSQSTEFANSLWEENPSATPEQVARKVATARAKLIKADVVERKLSKAQERIKELETRLGDYESSEPSMSPRGAGAPAASGKPADEAKAKMLAAANAMATKRNPV